MIKLSVDPTGRWVKHLLMLATLAFAMTWSAYPAGAAAPTPAPSEFSFPNGLRVVVVPDHRVPIVTHMVFYRIGSADELPGEEGLAHYLEHMMFKGTAAFPAGEFDRFVVMGGGFHNATTTTDGTTYFQRMPKSGLAHLMELEADRMQNLQITEQAALTERNVVLEEFRGGAGRPGFPFLIATAKALYGDHPYALPTIGDEAGIARFNGAKALAFYRRHYGPQRAIVVVGGDVTEAEVRAMANPTYGQVKRSDTVTPNSLVPDFTAAEQRVVVPHPRVSAVSVRRTYLVPAAMPIEDTTALHLFMFIVGDGMLSRLHRELVTEGIASAVSGGVFFRRVANEATFDATALPEVPAEVIEPAFERVLAAIAEHGISQAEFNDMKQRFLATRVYDRDNNATYCQGLGRLMTVGWSLADVLNFERRIQALSLEDVNRVGRNVLTDSRFVTGLLVPQTATPVATGAVR
jgi:zinc protease